MVRHFTLIPVLLASSLAAAQSSGSSLTVEQAAAWAREMQALEKAGDVRVLSSVRPSTKMRVEVEAARGARVTVELTGERMLQHLRTELANRGERNKLMDLKPTCNYYADARNGSVVETCTVSMTYKQPVPLEMPRVMYSYSIITQDSAGMFYREAWASTRKLF